MKYLSNFFVALCLIYAAFAYGQQEQWSWLHKKQFTCKERLAHKAQGEAICVSKDVPQFTQLLFSWNALRPLKGHFTFYAQVRNAKTKQWGHWHKMIDWGSGMQRSYASKSDGFSQYHHVRLEVRPAEKADAFAIKIESHHDADLSLVHSCAVNCADFTAFKDESHVNLAALLTSVMVPGVPHLSQFEIDHPRNDGLCSPTSCTMLTAYLLKKSLDPRAFAESSLDRGLDQYGSWPFNTAHAYTACEAKVFFAVGRLNSFKALHQRISQGVPVVVSVRGALAGAPKSYPHGHLLVVVGYDAQKHDVLCRDPAAPTASESCQRYALHDFLRAWERSKRLSYLAEPLTLG